MRRDGGQQGIFALILFAALAVAVYYGWTSRNQVSNFVHGVLEALGAAATASAVEN